mgnify:CR=1 FL=1
MFPFSITLRQKTNIALTEDNKQKLFEDIKSLISKHYACNIKISPSELSFTTKFFEIAWGINLDVLSPIDKGNFMIEGKEDKINLSYTFYIYKLIFLALIFSILFALIDSSLLDGLIFFIVLGILNWLIAISRQWFLLKQIANSK